MVEQQCAATGWAGVDEDQAAPQQSGEPSLGWASPERGLQWWAEERFPVTDPTLALIAAAWLPDGRIPLLMDWLAAKDPERWDGPGGLHLEWHLFAPLSHSECPHGHAQSLLAGPRSSRLAVLGAPCMLGWYAALVDLGSTLPDLGQRSWRVDVYVQPVGHLGRFRRSRDAGAWFAGRHSVHAAGC